MMDKVSESNRLYLSMMADIHAVNEALGLRTYLWGGLCIDVFEGRFLREHGDLDGFTTDLETHRLPLEEAYTQLGYKVSFNEAFSMLRIEKSGIHGSFNPLRINSGTAEWKHIGDEGSVYFPTAWLDTEPRVFYGVNVYTAGRKFDYAVKTKIAMLNPEWKLREKDLAAVAYLKKQLSAEQVTDEDIYKWFWSYNPFWFKRGYAEFFRPTLAWPVEVK